MIGAPLEALKKRKSRPEKNFLRPHLNMTLIDNVKFSHYLPIPTIDEEFKLLWCGLVRLEPGGSGAALLWGVPRGISHLENERKFDNNSRKKWERNSKAFVEFKKMKKSWKLFVSRSLLFNAWLMAPINSPACKNWRFRKWTACLQPSLFSRTLRRSFWKATAR